MPACNDSASVGQAKCIKSALLDKVAKSALGIPLPEVKLGREMIGQDGPPRAHIVLLKCLE